MGLTIDRLARRAVGQHIVIEHALVVDEAARDHHLTLFVYQHIVTVAHALVEAVITRLKALLDFGEQQPVLDARGLG